MSRHTHVDQESVTKIREPISSFLWTIEGYDFLSRGDAPIESPSFHGGSQYPNGEYDYEWKMELIRTPVYVFEFGFDGIGSYDVDMKLTLVSTSQSVTFPAETTFKLSLVAPDGRAHEMFKDENKIVTKYTGSSESWSSLTAFPRVYWRDGEFDDTGYRTGVRNEGEINKIFLENDTWKIFCQIWIGDWAEAESSLSLSSEKVRLRQLPPKLHSFLLGGDYTDLEILVGNAPTIRAHKLILRANSEVFRAMLDNPMKEASSSSIEILDFGVETVRAMLQFLYTGKLQVGETSLEELVRIADKYDLDDLRKDAETKIYSKVTVQTAPRILVFADNFNLNQLKKNVLRFIHRNKPVMSQNAEFQDLLCSNPKLMGEVFAFLE